MLRTHPARRLAALAAPLLLAVSLTACGGGSDASGSDAPEDASKEDFCAAYAAKPELDDSLDDAPPQEQAEAIKDALDKLVSEYEDVGTPEEIPDDAREGFEISLEQVNDISKDDIEKTLEEKNTGFVQSDVSGEDKKKVDSFKKWADDYCA